MAKKRKGDWPKKLVYAMILACVVFAAYIAIILFLSTKKNTDSAGREVVRGGSDVNLNEPSAGDEKKSEQLENPPEEARALYITGWTAGNQAKMDGIIDLIGREKLNAAVIDIKDYSGYISYESGLEEVKRYKSVQIMIKDIDELIKKLHGKNIYAIARITVFQDPVLARARPDLAIKNKFTGKVWRDNKGLSWIDPASKENWDYIVKIAKEASEKGFDEINFDYVRFPSDGSLGNTAYPFYDAGKSAKREVIKDFFSYLNASLEGEKISVDLFGLAAVNKDDLGIGQVIEDAYGNFDFVSPMTYPSHYANGFQGYANPAAYPYEVVKYSIERAKERLDEFKKSNALAGGKNLRDTKLRPWLQAFDMGGMYGAEKVKLQIKASDESGGMGWILWNPSNVYAARIAGINE